MTTCEQLKRLSPENFYIRLNKALVGTLGPLNAYVVQLLIDFKEELDQDTYLKWDKGEFFFLQEWLESELKISSPTASKIFRELEESGVITTSWKGIPKTRYITLNYDHVKELMSDPSFKVSDRLMRYREMKEKADKKEEYERIVRMRL